MNAPTLWSVAEAAAATNGQGQGDWRASGVSTDSRTVKKGDLFVAIQGPKFNGHRFAADALERGAAAVMVHERPNGLASDAPVLMVANTMAGLEALGVAARARTAAKVAAVTGSVGKKNVTQSPNSIHPLCGKSVRASNQAAGIATKSAIDSRVISKVIVFVNARRIPGFENAKVQFLRVRSDGCPGEAS